MSEVNADFVKFVFFQTIKKALKKDCAESLGECKLTQDDEKALFSLSKKHDLAHLVCQGLDEYRYVLSDEGKKAFDNARMMAVVRYEQLHYEYKKITETFEKNEIPFVPLKGAVLRDYYCEPWYRTSCDIDILVKKSDLQKAVRLLCETNGYQADKKTSYHDISLYSPSNVHLELHFTILENQENIDGLLAKVWDYVRLKDGCAYEYRQTNEFLAFHLLAHILYHFTGGGCGVRTILDFWIIRNGLEMDERVFDAMLEQCGIKAFYRSIVELMNVWFEGTAHTEKTLKLERYVLSGGVYGNLQNKMKVVGTEVKGKKSYVWQRIFCPYDTIKHRYPILQKHKWLLPVYEVVRWVETIFHGKAKKLKMEVTSMDSNTDAEKEEFKKFLAEIGL